MHFVHEVAIPNHVNLLMAETVVAVLTKKKFHTYVNPKIERNQKFEPCRDMLDF